MLTNVGHTQSFGHGRKKNKTQPPNTHRLENASPSVLCLGTGGTTGNEVGLHIFLFKGVCDVLSGKKNNIFVQ